LQILSSTTQLTLSIAGLNNNSGGPMDVSRHTTGSLSQFAGSIAFTV
jgi:hypothetical protein